MPPLSKSPRVSFLLNHLGLKDALDIIEHLPRRYEDYGLTGLSRYPENGERAVLFGKVVGAVKRPVRFKRASLTSFLFRLDDGREFRVEAWNRDYLSSRLKDGSEATILVHYDSKRSSLSLVSLREGRIPADKTLKAVHSLPDGVSEATFSALLRRSFKELEGSFIEPLPPEIRSKYRLLTTIEAYREAHFPSSRENLRAAIRTLKYLEAFLYELLIIRGKDERRLKRPAHMRAIDLTAFKLFVSSLPFPPTSDQKGAVNEAYKDMSGDRLMYRLLQGDVGTGKTLVSALVLFLNYCRGYQGAFLAPTEALARQHFETLKRLFAGTSMKIVLLVGNQSPEERREALAELRSGEADLAVGTHALFSKGVEYASLHLAVIDEQHKFGVSQRISLFGKGEGMDVYMMSATPIPRSLAQAVYGDLDISTLHEFPSGKRDVETLLYPYHDRRVQDEIKAALAAKRRVYVVSKEIHGDDPRSSATEIYRRYQNAYPGQVALATGEMDEEGLEKALSAFRSGEKPILVATQVVEVGLDVKEAGLMVVYDASRFALSSLHQLRGRVGRDGQKAKFILLSDKEDAPKLAILLKTDDGFKIAEEDLRLRGPGELFGTRQSGELTFAVLDPVSDLKILSFAREDAIHLKEEGGSDYEIALDYASRRQEKGTLGPS